MMIFSKNHKNTAGSNDLTFTSFTLQNILTLRCVEIYNV